MPATGADLVCFSGGKAIGGPQSTGILCGRRDLVGAAALRMLDMDDHLRLWEPPASLPEAESLAGIPRQGLGRGFKVAKENVAALLKALELFLEADWQAEIVGQTRWLDEISETLGLPHGAA
ncbi:MAG: hypothetical protein VYE73_06535 [Acidobacteriota bacterium]|nr:hypothetical protein [Acidobacteriota bacterium]